MPKSVTTTVQEEMQRFAPPREMPTHFDLYDLQTSIERLTIDTKVITDAIAELDASVADVKDVVEYLSKAVAEISGLRDEVASLRGAVDDLAKVIEKIPKRMAQ